MQACRFVLSLKVMEGKHTQHAQATHALTLHVLCVCVGVCERESERERERERERDRS